MLEVEFSPVYTVDCLLVTVYNINVIK